MSYCTSAANVPGLLLLKAFQFYRNCFIRLCLHVCSRRSLWLCWAHGMSDNARYEYATGDKRCI